MLALRTAIAGLLLAAPARAAGPADDLLRLVPADVGAVLVVEDLRGQAGVIASSPLARAIGDLPAVRAWAGGDQAKGLRAVRRELESALGADLAAIRDELLGDAVVLALEAGPPGHPEQSRGLLLLRHRNPKLLDKLVEAANRAEREAKTLQGLTSRTRNGLEYTVRTFNPESGKPTEAYARIGNDLFAWANSEALLGRVLAGRAGGGLGDDPRFRRVRSAFPDRTLASLYFDPKALARLDDAAGDRAADDGLPEPIRRYLQAIDYAGIALQWRDGPIVHVHELLDPDRLDEPVRRWASGPPGGPAALLRRVPSGVVVLAAGHVDFAALYDLGLGLVPPGDRPKVENGAAVVRGLLLGRDPRSQILPNLGPGLIAYLDSPPGGDLDLPAVVALEVGGGPEIAAALDNAIQTLFALLALDAKRAPSVGRLAHRRIGEVPITVLAGLDRPLACALAQGLLVVGTSPEAVAGFAAEPTARPATRFERFRAEFFPEASSFLYADLQGLGRLADRHRDALARRLAANRSEGAEAARRDLDQVLGLLRLFRGAFVTRSIAPDGSGVHHTIGLIAREPGAKP